MKIIRIEHETKKTGVYTTVPRPQALSMKIWSDFTFGEKHPTPEKDSLFNKNLRLAYPEIWAKAYDPHFDYLIIGRFAFLKYGFKNIKQLRAWFYTDDIFYLMHDAGFHIVELEVNDIVEGHTQVAYNSNGEILSQTEHNILEYLNIK